MHTRLCLRESSAFANRKRAQRVMIAVTWTPDETKNDERARREATNSSLCVSFSGRRSLPRVFPGVVYTVIIGWRQRVQQQCLHPFDRFDRRSPSPCACIYRDFDKSPRGWVPRPDHHLVDCNRNIFKYISGCHPHNGVVDIKKEYKFNT